MASGISLPSMLLGAFTVILLLISPLLFLALFKFGHLRFYWGIMVLFNAHRLKDTDKKRCQLERACRMFKKGRNYLPANRSFILQFWGWSMSTLASLETDPERKQTLLKEAYAIYEDALSEDEGSQYILNAMGDLLLRTAEMEKRPENRVALLSQAREHFEKAEKGEPAGKYRAMQQRAYVLSQLAELEEEGHARQALLEEACVLDEVLTSFDRDNANNHRGYGCALSRRADLQDNPETKVGLLRKALAEYRKAHDLEPGDETGSYGLGWILMTLGDTVQDANEKGAFFREARDLFQAAGVWEERAADVRINLLYTLHHLATLEEDPDTKYLLLQQACEKYEEGAREEPSNAWIWINWTKALRMLADLEVDPKRKRHYLEQTREKGLRAASLEPAVEAYNCACDAALLGDEDACRNWLVTAERLEALPPLQHLQTDPDLDGVQEAAWFKEFLARREYPATSAKIDETQET